MPTSDAQGREWVAEILDAIGPDLKLIVDVGPGDGTYERIFRCQTPNANWIGVEIWAPYISRFNLWDSYDTVVCCNIMDYKWPEGVDLVILGDIVEHLPEADARLLLETCKKKAKNVIVSLPIIDSHQGEVDGNPYEAHLYQWKFEQILELMTPCSAWRGDVLGRFWWRG